MDNSSIPIELTEQKVRVLDYKILVDILNNGMYSADITNDLEEINITTDLQLKSKGQVLGKPSANVATITLNNTNGKYSPNNSENIEHDYAPNGKFRINTKIKILGGFIDENGESKTRVLFVGVITGLKNKITKESKQIVLDLKDNVKFLQKLKNPNHVYKNNRWYEAALFDVSISDVVNLLIDYSLGTSYSRTVHSLLEIHPIIELPIGQSVWETIQSLCQACEGRAFFENDQFKFYSPLSPEWNEPLESQYSFTAYNIQEFTETIDEDAVINKWKITSNPKTMQFRQVLCGTPSTNTISMTDEYWSSDTKNALGVDNKTITLKSQDDDLSWIGSFNVPLVYTQTYSDLIQTIPSPTQSDIDTMNSSSLIKVWDRLNNIQLTINSINVKSGTIELLNELDPNNYNIQIIYQYYQDQIVYGKYRWYIYDLEKIGANIEYPVIIANNIEENITYSTTNPTNNLYLSDWTIYEGNKRVKFKLTNNVPIAGESNELNVVYITKFEVWGNALEVTSPLSFEAIDGDTINLFENEYAINNDYITNITQGKALCDYYLYHYKSNLTFLDVNTKGIPQIDLLDRVTINESVSGNNFDYLVIGIKHSIKKDGWKTNLQLESLIPPWTYDESRVNALFYKMGTSYLSLYSDSTPSNPNAFSLIEQTFVQTSGEVVTRVYVTFIPPLYAYYSHTLIQMSSNNGLTWTDCGTSNDGKFYIYNVEVGKNYKIRAVTVSLNGQKSNAIEGVITITGKDSPPSDITSFNVVQSGSILKISLVPPGDPDIRNYELRYGPTWTNSYLLKTFNDSQTTVDAVQEGTQTFWVKAVDNSGNYSEHAKKAVVTIFGLKGKNVIATNTSYASDWTLTNMYICPLDTDCAVIDTIETFNSGEYFSDIFEGGSTLKTGAEVVLPAIDLGPNVVEENYFYYDAYGVVRLKTTKTLSDFTNFFDIFGYAHQYVTPQFKVETFANIELDYTKNENNYVNMQYRTSFDGVIYSDWIDLVNHQFFGRYVQIKLKPGSLNGHTNVQLCGATVKVDVPDLEENIENVNLSAAKTLINFSQRFFDTPKSIALFTCDSTGKQVTWRSNPSEWTKDGFYIELLDNSNNLISGKLILAKVRGY